MDIVKRANFVLFTRLVILTPIVVAIGLVASNRIAGPIYHMRRYLESALRGDIGKEIRLRQNDELQDLASAINSFVKKIRQDKARRSEEASRVSGKLDEMASRGENASSADKLRVLAREVRELGEI